MASSTPQNPPSSSKKRSAADSPDIRKRTRSSASRQDLTDNEQSPSAQRGGASAPAAGVRQRPSAQAPGQGRLFRNLGRSPLGARLGVPSPARPRAPTSAPRTKELAGATTGAGGVTPGSSPAEVAGRRGNTGRPSQKRVITPAKSPNTTGQLPTPGRTKEKGGSPPSPTPNNLGPNGDWGYPDPRWNTDKQIIDGWKALEGLIAGYVSEIIVDSIPDIDTTHLVYPYEAVCRLSDLAGPIVRNEKYAKYIFQLSLWNILDVKFLSHMATEWACEEKGTHQWRQRTKGLASAMDLLTFDHAMDPRSTMLRREREKWYIWRKDTVDVVYGWLSKHPDYERTVENAVFDILSLYQGHFKPAFAGGDRKSWDNLVWRTTEIVASAVQLSIMMRRSQDGTWSPFIPLRLVPVRPESITKHQDTATSLPPGQTGIIAGSRVTMTVVPGLCKYEMTNVADDPAHPGLQNTAIRKKVRMKAKCLIDITEAQTGAIKDGDIWVPEDL